MEKPNSAISANATDQADRDGDQRNDGRAHGAQEHEDHQRHQHHRFGDGGVDRLDGAVDEDRVVVGDVDADAGRQVGSRTLSSKSRTPADSSSGLAVAWRITPSETESRPFRRTEVRSSCGPCTTRATSPMRTGRPLTLRMVRRRNCSGVCRSVAAVTLNSRCCSRCGRPALPGWSGAARLPRPAPSGGRRPGGPGRARCAWSTCVRHRPAHRPRRGGLQHRLGNAVGQVGELQRVVGVRAQGQPDHREGVGLDLGDHRLVDACGRRWRTRLTLSRTSAAADRGRARA
jgi:hypothetical protein